MIRIDTVEDARRWVEVYVDGEPPDGGIDGAHAVDAPNVALGCGGPANLLYETSASGSLEVPEVYGQGSPHGAARTPPPQPRLLVSAQTTPLQLRERPGLTVDLDLTTNTGQARAAAREKPSTPHRSRDALNVVLVEESPRATREVGEPSRGAHTHGDRMRAK